MNKGLEVIEAHHLFALPYDRISVVVQPQSAIHSMVEFADGSVKAHLGTTDMRIPIQFALSYPERWDAPVAPLDFRTLGSLEFAAPDEDTFRCLALARAAGERGGTLPCVMNAANEVAVAAFLAGEGSYLGIAACVEAVMDAHEQGGAGGVQRVGNAAAAGRAGRLGPRRSAPEPRLNKPLRHLGRPRRLGRPASLRGGAQRPARSPELSGRYAGVLDERRVLVQGLCQEALTVGPCDGLSVFDDGNLMIVGRVEKLLDEFIVRPGPRVEHALRPIAPIQAHQPCIEWRDPHDPLFAVPDESGVFGWKWARGIHDGRLLVQGFRCEVLSLRPGYRLAVASQEDLSKIAGVGKPFEGGPCMCGRMSNTRRVPSFQSMANCPSPQGATAMIRLSAVHIMKPP